MDRQGFIDFNNQISPEKSGRAGSYAQAIMILDEALQHQDVVDLKGQSLYDITDIKILDEVSSFVRAETRKVRKKQQSIFDHVNEFPPSYARDYFCSSALTSLKKYVLYLQDVKLADEIVAHEDNPQKISKKLIAHFDLTKEGEDIESVTNRRKGQDYFRRMVLANYNSRCALTGIDIPQLLMASHIIPWRDKSHKKERLNPCNGICLSALYDKAFDKGFITFLPDDFSVRLSSALRENESKEYFDQHFGCIIGKKLTLPSEFKPNREFLAYHCKEVFLGL